MSIFPFANPPSFVPLNIQSRAIRTATYDVTTGTLIITFKTGKAYTYNKVPPSVIAQFESAPSAGAYYDRRIKGRY
ncbi:KTSC domain-containing protein [Acetobacter thailandicus]|uniref:KTSC domain-containing protein n=1 Tax=Acetobacter thailandicus TaxID=1502842 RepID=UPI001BAD27D0|nr:KTSC domain-containing protein [Acetobacter thailandicus]MBS0985772.1 KTSC domain-containing protein [Acetobacter thailandicus]